MSYYIEPDHFCLILTGSSQKEKKICPMILSKLYNAFVGLIFCEMILKQDE